MILRKIHAQIQEDLNFFPVLSIIGPRQVGKTTLAKNLKLPNDRKLLYLDLEWDEDRAKLADAGTYLRQNEEKCVVIDEVQIMPSLFPLLRSLVDQHRVPARFVLLGSASPDLLKRSAESLAGRIAYHELCPFSLTEIYDPKILRQHWFRGGFPDAFLAPTDALSYNWLTQFFTTFVERDLTYVIGKEINASNMLRFIRMLGHFHGQTLNLSELSNSLGMATQTVSRYLDILAGTFLIQRLPPFYQNTGKQLTKSPKFYFRDSGFYHAIARVKNLEELWSSPKLGASWEGYVIEQIHRVVGKQCEYFFYRTKSGAEVDLLIITPRNEKICIEIKYTNSPSISRGFHSSIIDLNPVCSYVIVPDAETYTRADGIVIINLYDFLTVEIQTLNL